MFTMSRAAAGRIYQDPEENAAFIELLRGRFLALECQPACEPAAIEATTEQAPR